MRTQEELLLFFKIEIKDAIDTLSGLSNRYKKEAFEYKPFPNKWSAIECIVHINTTNKSYLGKIKNSLTASEEVDIIERDYKPRYLISKFIDSMKAESKMKFKSPKVFMDSYNDDFEKVIHDFFTIQNELINLAEASGKYDLSKIKFTSPVTKLLRLQLGEAFMIIIEHQKRHLQQAKIALKNSV